MLLRALLLALLLFPSADAKSLYVRCFQRTVRRSIDNSQPILELFYVTPHQCIDECIYAANNNAPRSGFCRSFTYDHMQRSCRLYDHDGYQPPAILHPADGFDHYTRTAVLNECAGPAAMLYPLPYKQPSKNPNLHVLRVASTGNGASHAAGVTMDTRPRSDNGDYRPLSSTTVSPGTRRWTTQKQATQSSTLVDELASPLEPSSLRLYEGPVSNTQSELNEKQISDALQPELLLQRKHFNRNEPRPGSSAGLPAGSNRPVNIPSNAAELGYEVVTERTRERSSTPVSPLPTTTEVTTKFPSIDQEELSLSEVHEFYPTARTRSQVHEFYPTPPRPRSEVHEFYATPSSRSEVHESYAIPRTRSEVHELNPSSRTTRPSSYFLSTPSLARETQLVTEATAAPHFGYRSSIATESPKTPKGSPQCSTSTAYYVVIGNEIILPISLNEKDVTVLQGIEQSQCARHCTENKGPDGRPIKCSSMNYFPLTQKCEMYSILAEPHGPGSLVENDDVIYAEKFCLPTQAVLCQEDEIFILYVQKRLRTKQLGLRSANSITSCLKHCLEHRFCKSAVFDSNRRQCSLHDVNVGSTPSAMEEAEVGWVLIENGCSSSGRRSAKAFSDHKVAVSSLESQWMPWSECQFKLRGVAVRVRTRPCESECVGGGLQVQQC